MTTASMGIPQIPTSARSAKISSIAIASVSVHPALSLSAKNVPQHMDAISVRKDIA
jgi:hypothetical protein